MLSLVYKDLLLQRGSKSLIYMLVMPVVSAFAFSTDVLYVILPYIAGSYLYIVYANALDDKYNAEKVLLSMPIPRSSIVTAKYLGMFFYMVFFLTVVAVISFLIRLIVPGFSDIPSLTWHHMIQFTTIAAIYYGIMFPLYFKIGYHKSRWVNYFAMLLSAGLYALATKGLSSLTGLEIESLQGAFEYITGIPGAVWNMILPLCAAAIIALSIRLSVRHYKRREF